MDASFWMRILLNIIKCIGFRHILPQRSLLYNMGLNIIIPQQRIRLRGLQSVSKGAVTKFRATGSRKSKGRVRV